MVDGASKSRGAVNDDNYDFLFKIVMMGNAAVGKTNLLMRFTKD